MNKNDTNTKKNIVLNSDKKINPLALIIIGAVVVVIGFFIIRAVFSSNQSQGVNNNITLNPVNLNTGISDSSSEAASRSVQEISYTSIDPTQDQISFPLDTFDDGIARYYSYDTDGIQVNFFLLKSSDGVVRAAFNACDVCYKAKLGYSQNGDVMICNKCKQEFPSIRINLEKGGCNPAPLQRSVEGDNLIIMTANIETGKRFF